MDTVYHRKASPSGTLQLPPPTLSLDGLPDDRSWTLSFQPGCGYLVAIHVGREQMLDSGTHATPQAAVAEAVRFAVVHRLFAGPLDGFPDPEAAEEAPAPDWGPWLQLGLRLVLALLCLAALFWQFMR